MAEPRSGFRVPAEVPRYFADRGLRPSFSWLDIWGEEHAHAFTVAKAVDVELLGVMRDSIKRAIDNGQGFENWRAALKPELERIGWGKPRLVADPTGERPDRKVDFTAPGRLQTIFSSNMRAARAAGQWERIQRTKEALPYLLYVRTTSLAPRDQHLRWAGTILPADDPWWRTHFPPNGWRCKCAVRQVSRFEREDKLGQPGFSDERPALDEKPFLNRRTGEIVRVPDGIDPGWAHNPGLAAERRRAAADALAGRIEAAAAGPSPAAVRQALRLGVEDLVRSEPFERHHAEALNLGARRDEAAATAKAAGQSKPAQDAAAAKAAPWTHVNLPIAVLPRRLDALRGLGLERAPVTITASDAAIAHSHAAHPKAPADWAKLQAVLDHGEIHTSQADPARIWAFAKVAGEEWSAVLTRVRGAWRTLTLFRPARKSYRANQRTREGRSVMLSEGENDADEGP
ncbi:phage head morphogenesis protein [Methylobacterium iners]|uniref:Phage head morphogenesis domain-containing protein n=1 Tax=Methylobacterium iners TaxID=418707 RepID=A0ABQ4RUE8_9HYPH|nr:phage minor head protein [Methylobacterium iners]GJD93329.1 hypothetical protein OCOJLMKI_0521 [Methylobacterium iners]